MYKEAHKGDLIRNDKYGWVANVIEVNEYWGWFKVKYTDGVVKTHRMNNYGNGIFTLLTPDEVTDFYLESVVGLHWNED